MDNSDSPSPIIKRAIKFLNDIAHVLSKENINNIRFFVALRSKAKPHLNTLVISVLEIKRLKSVVWGEDDFYWEYETLKGTEQSSCVMGFITLKGILPDTDYEEIERLFKINQENNGKDNI